MSSEERLLQLPRDPMSARRARTWVAERLRTLGRNDLVDTATLGVSELVTNAILHTDSPIVVSLRGTADHPRIEVRDSSRQPVRVNAEMAEEEYLLSTVGRGIGLVALNAASWGSEIAADGKLVWFEPAVEAGTGELPGEVYDLDQVVGDLPEEDDAGLVRVQLLDMPVRLFAHHRLRYTELVRELRLLALTDGRDQPLARELTDLAVQVERDRRRSRGVDRLARAHAEDRDRVDLEYHVPPDAPARMARLLVLLEAADEFCRTQRLLAVAPSAQAVALRRWYFGEFVHQARGADPTPWPGGFVVEEPPG